MKKYYRLLLFLLVVPTYCQTITFDTTFGSSGYSEPITIPSFNSRTDTALLPDGQFITCHNSDSFLRLKKINQNGIIDTSFNTIFYLGTNSTVLCQKIAVYNGKIMVAGMSKTSLFATYDMILIRFNLDGTLDNTFGTNGYRVISYGTSNDEPTDMIFDELGNIFVYTKHANDFYIAKTNSSGTVDTSFGTNGLLYTNSYNPNSPSVVAGTLFHKVLLQNDGKFLFAGAKRNATTLNFESYLERKNQDGTFDASFGTNGQLTMSNTEYCEIKSFEFNYETNSILLLHEYDNNNVLLPRVMLSKIQITDGALVTSFGTNGLTPQYSFPEVRGSVLRHIATLSNSKILIAGNVSNFVVTPQINDQLFVMRFNANGSVDFTSSSNGYHIFSAAPPIPSNTFTARNVPRLLVLNNDSFVIAYSGEGASAGSRTYLAKFTGATQTLDNDLIETKEDFVKVYPNPASAYFVIQSNLLKESNFSYEIVDLLGRVKKQGSSSFNAEITIDDSTKGIFIVNIKAENGEQFSKKIVVN